MAATAAMTAMAATVSTAAIATTMASTVATAAMTATVASATVAATRSPRRSPFSVPPLVSTAAFVPTAAFVAAVAATAHDCLDGGLLGVGRHSLTVAPVVARLVRVFVHILAHLVLPAATTATVAPIARGAHHRVNGGLGNGRAERRGCLAAADPASTAETVRKAASASATAAATLVGPQSVVGGGREVVDSVGGMGQGGQVPSATCPLGRGGAGGVEADGVETCRRARRGG
eukprot:TRINITY_DN12623_c0_g1_i1.p1 TRINITY_DN12623_c0_g1~~TRINITY_DN12623_c0_g1_i1.p1  ORF type:complete len:232 (+),score=27.25 TRINITY_DN12623_c0_g1_i1:174-869(+)